MKVAVSVRLAQSFLLLTLSVVFSDGATGPDEGCRTLHFLPENNGSALVNHVIRTITDKTQDQCQIACYLTDACRSFNYGHRTRLCQISNSDHIEHKSDLVPMEGFVYYGTKNPCSTSPCPANYSCQTTKTDYLCVCPPGRICPNKISITCENQAATLSCDDKNLNIRWAKYGRSSNDVCKHNSMRMCGEENITLSKVRQQCEGKNTCTFRTSSNIVLGYDPCPGVYKYLEVRYICI